jgi:MoaA/NifB/PqqE/SkfB family radical SAM enzyme
MTHVAGERYWFPIPRGLFGEERPRDGEVVGTLLENDQILGPPGLNHSQISKFGKGSYSIWSDPNEKHASLHFSSSDGSDPAKNGRRYTLFNRALKHSNDWDHRHIRRWHHHSRGALFLRRGGANTPPPLMANMGLTDICNFRCGICGSQNMAHTVNRRHMDIRVFQMVADTLFPLLMSVEFNSRGEPLMHPHIDQILQAVSEYGIYFRMQTNGSQFRQETVNLLKKMHGELSVSIDATGAAFEKARRFGKWDEVNSGMRRLMAARDRDELSVSIYPTLTRNTIAGSRELIDWALELNIDKIDFHLYDPIYGGNEEVPTKEELDTLKAYAAKADPGNPVEIRVAYETIKEGSLPVLRYPSQLQWPNIPRTLADQGHPEYTCMAPSQLVDIDLDGNVCVCCQMQERSLGSALTVEAFADCWFGAEYRAIRKSLQRGADPLHETCRTCVKNYAPETTTTSPLLQLEIAT